MCRSPRSNANFIFRPAGRTAGRGWTGRFGGNPANSYIYGMVSGKLKKLGIAGFLFFLLKGLLWIVLFLLAWSEV
jgi:hypothetical protein